MRAVVQRVLSANVSAFLSAVPKCCYELTRKLSELHQVQYFLRNITMKRPQALNLRHYNKIYLQVNGEVISSIGKGLCVLLGISRDDTFKDIEYIVRKILNLRLFEDENCKRWSKSLADKQFEILCVSQFTLYSVLKGNKLDFHQSMASDQSEQFYQQFLDHLTKQYKPELIKDGKFGAYMVVNIQNDGPVTVNLDSRTKASDNDKKTATNKTEEDGEGSSIPACIASGNS